jgi:hypothetical protein
MSGSEPEKQTAKKPRVGDGTPGPGRPRGIPNKTTSLLKDALMIAATNAGGKAGLVGYLTQQATANPQSFLPLLGKVIPLQITGGQEPVKIEITRRIVGRSE